MQANGGVARIKRLTIDTTGRLVPFVQTTMSIRLKVESGTLRIYFKEADFDANDHYLELSAGETLSEPIEDTGMWMIGIGGDAVVQLLTVLKKG